MNSLIQLIQEAGGSLSFEQFMQHALYHPQHGYYTCNIRTVGRHGDFSTSATITPLLGQAIAQWLLQNKPPASIFKRWHVIEVGGGNGDLAHAVLNSIPFWERCFLQYHIVEISTTLRTKQQALLSGYAVKWHTDIHVPLKEARGHAMIFSNELVDAFPCTVLRRNHEKLEQLELILSNGGIAEGWTQRLDYRLENTTCSTLANLHVLPPHYRFEIHLSYHDWLASWQSLWQQGHMLTIDYGDVYPDLYHRRPDGTMRGYFLHQRMEGDEIYHRFGKQDLTADVNFTDLQTWGTESGLKNHPLVTQRDFLFQYLPPTLMEKDTPERDCVTATEGAGFAYKVLWQSR